MSDGGNEEMTAPPPVAASPMAPIDPTKNVLDLVRAESKYQDAMRVAEITHQSAIREMESRYQNAMREAETRRVNDLARQKDANDRAQAEKLGAQVADVSTILSDRIAKLEQFRYESSGKGLGVTTVVGYLLAVVGLGLAIAAKFGPQ
jgi:hypothetical protein